MLLVSVYHSYRRMLLLCYDNKKRANLDENSLIFRSLFLDASMKRRQLTMFNPIFDRYHLRLFKTTLTKLGHFENKKIVMPFIAI